MNYESKSVTGYGIEGVKACIPAENIWRHKLVLEELVKHIKNESSTKEEVLAVAKKIADIICAIELIQPEELDASTSTNTGAFTSYFSPENKLQSEIKPKEELETE